jgi:hypothetical protein
VTELAADLFDRANNVDLGADWTAIQSSLNIVDTSQVRYNTSNADAAEKYVSATWPADQYSEITFGTGTSASSAGTGYGPICRAGSDATFYRAVGNAVGWSFRRIVSGASTNLGGGTGTTFATGDRLRLEVRTVAANCAYSLLKNDVQFHSGTDTSPIASGSAGLAYSFQDLTTRVASWSGGDFVSSAPTLYVTRSTVRLN